MTFYIEFFSKLSGLLSNNEDDDSPPLVQTESVKGFTDTTVTTSTVTSETSNSDKMICDTSDTRYALHQNSILLFLEKHFMFVFQNSVEFTLAL